MTATTLPLTTQTAIILAHPDGGRVVKSVNHWLCSSGSEWTVKRLKAIRAACLQLRAGNQSLVKQIYQENSISYTRNNLLPRGPFRSVVRDYLQTQRPIVLRRCDLILRCYTAVRLSALSRAQFDKSFNSITGSYRGSREAVVAATGYVKLGAVTLGLPRHASPKRADISRLKPGTSTHGAEGRPRDLLNLPYGKLAWSLASSCAAPENLMERYHQADGFRRLCIDGGADESTTGHIACLQEAGAKARVVAVPNAWNQWLFQPLHELLDGFARNLSCSAVHDQNRGAWFIQEYLGKETLYCFDLSSATDRFPRVLQTQLLRFLNLGEYADALEECCQAWQFSTGKGSQVDFCGLVDYAVGQPMGLYGSFPLFHLTHCCLLAGIAKGLGLPLSPTSFVVLGDDVLIRDQLLAELYRMTLTELGVDISDTKSIVSRNVAEFAGFVGVATRHGVTTYRPYKHDSKGSLGSPLGLLYSLGSKITFRRFRKWVVAFQRTRGWRAPDLSPLVPTDDEVGVNPATISPDRFANLLHHAELVALDPEALDYVVPGFEYSEDWRDIVEELFNKQSPKKAFTSLSEVLRSQERHGVLEEPEKTPDLHNEDQFKRRPPSTLETDSVMRIFTHKVAPVLEVGIPQDPEYDGSDQVVDPRSAAETPGVESSRGDNPSLPATTGGVRRMHLD